MQRRHSQGEQNNSVLLHFIELDLGPLSKLCAGCAWPQRLLKATSGLAWILQGPKKCMSGWLVVLQTLHIALNISFLTGHLPASLAPDAEAVRPGPGAKASLHTLHIAFLLGHQGSPSLLDADAALAGPGTIANLAHI